jgi:hypothetical protein
MFYLFELMLELMAKPGAELRPKFIGFFCHITPRELSQRLENDVAGSVYWLVGNLDGIRLSPIGQIVFPNPGIYAELVAGRRLHQPVERRYVCVLAKIGTIGKRPQSAERRASESRRTCRLSPQKSL